MKTNVQKTSNGKCTHIEVIVKLIHKANHTLNNTIVYNYANGTRNARLAESENQYKKTVTTNM